MLSILSSKKFFKTSNRSLRAYALEQKWNADIFEKIEELLINLAQHFQLIQLQSTDVNIELNLTQKGLLSETLSRVIQHKLFCLLCVQIACLDGIKKAFRYLRTIIERVLTEMILSVQNNSHISSHLWSAVRARGCQFLGPGKFKNCCFLLLSSFKVH